MLPSLYCVYPVKPEELVFGLGLNSPAGQFPAWDHDGSIAKFFPYFATLAIFNAKSTLGVGGNFGLTWNLNERHRLASTYNGEANVEYDGKYKVYVPPMRVNGNLNTSIRYPAIATVGSGSTMTENFTIGIDVEWLEFSDCDDLSLDKGNDLAPPAGETIDLRQSWKDTWTAEWKASDTWNWRAGYASLESPIPDKAFSPIVHFEPVRHILGFGGSYTWGDQGEHVCLPYETSQGSQHCTTQWGRQHQSVWGGITSQKKPLFSIGYSHNFE